MTPHELFTPPQTIGLVLAAADALVENCRQVKDGPLALVNLSEVEDLVRARDLVREELRNRS